MADEQFYTILTNIGKAKVANAALLSSNVTLKTLKVGDGNGAYYNPTEDQKDLKNTVYTCNVGSVSVDKDNPNWILAETIIPGSVGGFTIREVGLFDTDGDMIAIGKYPETYKPVVANGASKDLNVRTIFEVSNAESVNLSINPSIIIATKEDINNLQKQITSNDEDIAVLSNSNLLINSEFRNPINQRNKIEYISGIDVYTIDRWKFYISDISNSITVNLTNEGITIKNSNDVEGGIFQLIEYPIKEGTKLTVSAKVDGEIRSLTGIYTTAAVTEIKDDFKIGFNKHISGYLHVVLYCQNSNVHTVEWVKLEIGDKATPFYPRSYGEELALCQRFYEKCVSKYEIRKISFNANNFSEGRVTFKVQKRIAPTISIYSYKTDTKGCLYESGSPGKDVAIPATYMDERGFSLESLEGLMTTGKIYLGYYEADSEIY